MLTGNPETRPSLLIQPYAPAAFAAPSETAEHQPSALEATLARHRDALLTGLHASRLRLGEVSAGSPRIALDWLQTAAGAYGALETVITAAIHHVVGAVVSDAQRAQSAQARRLSGGLDILIRRMLPFVVRQGEDGAVAAVEVHPAVSPVGLDDFFAHSCALLYRLSCARTRVGQLPQGPARSMAQQRMDTVVTELLLRFSDNVCNPGLLNELQSAVLALDVGSGDPVTQRVQQLFSETLTQTTAQLFVLNNPRNPIYQMLRRGSPVQDWFLNTLVGNETHTQIRLLNTLASQLPLPVTRQRDHFAPTLQPSEQGVASFYQQVVQRQISSGALHPVQLARQGAEDLWQQIQQSGVAQGDAGALYSRTQALLEGLQGQWGEIPLSAILDLDDEGQCRLRDSARCLHHALLLQWSHKGLIQPLSYVKPAGGGRLTQELRLYDPDSQRVMRTTATISGQSWTLEPDECSTESLAEAIGALLALENPSPENRLHCIAAWFRELVDPSVASLDDWVGRPDARNLLLAADLLGPHLTLADVRLFSRQPAHHLFLFLCGEHLAARDCLNRLPFLNINPVQLEWACRSKPELLPFAPLCSAEPLSDFVYLENVHRDSSVYLSAPTHLKKKPEFAAAFIRHFPHLHTLLHPSLLRDIGFLLKLYDIQPESRAAVSTYLFGQRDRLSRLIVQNKSLQILLALPDTLRMHTPFLLDILKKLPSAYAALPPALLNSRAFALEAIKVNRAVFDYLPPLLQAEVRAQNQANNSGLFTRLRRLIDRPT